MAGIEENKSNRLLTEICIFRKDMNNVFQDPVVQKVDSAIHLLNNRDLMFFNRRGLFKIGPNLGLILIMSNFSKAYMEVNLFIYS